LKAGLSADKTDGFGWFCTYITVVMQCPVTYGGGTRSRIWHEKLTQVS